MSRFADKLPYASTAENSRSAHLPSTSNWERWISGFRQQGLRQDIPQTRPDSWTPWPKRAFPEKLFHDFSKRDVQTILEVLHHAIQADTGDDVSHILRLLQRVIPCEKVIGGVARIKAGGAFEEFTSVINVSYSNDWLYRYGKSGYAAVDPVLTSLVKTLKTQVWTQTYESATSDKQKEFVEEARSFGLLNGITTGLLEGKHGLASFFSFAGGESAGNLRYKGVLEYVTPLLHRALLTNVGTPLHNRVKGLSPREISVLLWMKQGKTNWEISQILGITERTIRFHVGSIFEKLDVTSRTQAVALAIEDGITSGR